MKKQRGFTLIELLIVISLIGILSGFAIINLVGVRSRGRDAERKSDLQTIRSALELYRADENQYPATLPACAQSLRNPAGTSTYITSMPCDPLDNTAYSPYSPGPAPVQTYSLRACLENAGDPDRDQANTCAPGRVSYTVRNP